MIVTIIMIMRSGGEKLLLRDRNLYTTTNKCLQCLFKLMYAVF